MIISELWIIMIRWYGLRLNIGGSSGIMELGVSILLGVGG